MTRPKTDPPSSAEPRQRPVLGEYGLNRPKTDRPYQPSRAAAGSRRTRHDPPENRPPSSAEPLAAGSRRTRPDPPENRPPSSAEPPQRPVLRRTRP
jgi:hypothetical protein